MKKVLRLVPVVLLVAGMIVASFGAAGAQDDQLVFRMVAHGGTGNPFWIVVIKGMEDACSLLDADCAWLADPVDSVEDMPGYWDDALAGNPDGIGTTIPNGSIIEDAVTRAIDSDIPVIAFNTVDLNNPIDGVLFYIGANEAAGGISNAQRVLAAAEADGVEIVRGVCPIQEVGHAGLEARCAGVRSVFEEAGIPLDELTTNNNATESAGILADYFTANPETNAIFMLGPTPATSFNLFLEESGREPGEIYATTHDTSSEIYEMIQEGKLLQAIDQQPYLQGHETIMWLYLNSQYKLAPGGDIFTGPGVIDESNVADIITLTEAGFR